MIVYAPTVRVPPDCDTVTALSVCYQIVTVYALSARYQILPDTARYYQMIPDDTRCYQLTRADTSYGRSEDASVSVGGCPVSRELYGYWTLTALRPCRVSNASKKSAPMNPYTPLHVNVSSGPGD